MATKQRETAITVSEEFASGYDAWVIREADVSTNPYPVKTMQKEHRRWNAGWYAARGEDYNREVD